jgi:hypothetical protein
VNIDKEGERLTHVKAAHCELTFERQVNRGVKVVKNVKFGKVPNNKFLERVEKARDMANLCSNNARVTTPSLSLLSLQLQIENTRLDKGPYRTEYRF